MPHSFGVLRFDDNDNQVIARGEIDGEKWTLLWGEHVRIAGVRFAGAHDFALAPPVTGRISAAVAAVAGRTVVVGIAPPDAVAVRADRYEVPTVGEHDVFVAIFDDDAIPERVVAIDSHGRAFAEHALVPDRSDIDDVGRHVTVEAVPITGDRSYENVAARGSVGDASWSYAVAVSGDSMHEYTNIRAAGGFGGGGGGFGPIESPGPARVLRVRGGAGSAGVHVLAGWADPSVTRIELRLDSGEVIDVPVVGRDLDIATVLFAVGLPSSARLAIIDGFDDTGGLVGRTWPGR